MLVLYDGGEIQFSFLSVLPSPPARATAVTKLFIAALSKPLLSNVNNNNGKRKSWASPGCQCSSVSIAIGLFIALDCGCVDKRPHTWQSQVNTWLFWRYHPTKREPDRVKWLLHTVRTLFSGWEFLNDCVHNNKKKEKWITVVSLHKQGENDGTFDVDKHCFPYADFKNRYFNMSTWDVQIKSSVWAVLHH